MKTPEGYLKDRIKAYLTGLQPKPYWYMPVPGGYGKQTIDFLVCINGRFLGIETKAPGKKPTPRQEQCMKEIIASGGRAFWCDSWDSFLVNMFGAGFARPNDRERWDALHNLNGAAEQDRG